METVTHLAHVCQHRFRCITRKPLKVAGSLDKPFAINNTQLRLPFSVVMEIC